MQILSVGIDLGKTTFHLVALSAAGKVLVRKKFTAEAAHHLHRKHADSLDRDGSLFGAHFLGRVLREQGHDVKLIPAQFVKPFCEVQQERFSRCRSHR